MWFNSLSQQHNCCSSPFLPGNAVVKLLAFSLLPKALKLIFVSLFLSNAYTQNISRDFFPPTPLIYLDQWIRFNFSLDKSKYLLWGISMTSKKRNASFKKQVKPPTFHSNIFCFSPNNSTFCIYSSVHLQYVLLLMPYSTRLIVSTFSDFSALLYSQLRLGLWFYFPLISYKSWRVVVRQ